MKTQNTNTGTKHRKHTQKQNNEKHTNLRNTT